MSGQLPFPDPLITSGVGDVASETLAGGATLIELREITDDRGSISVAEVGAQLPFVPARMFVVYDVPPDAQRGCHAHRALHEFLVCIRGSCVITLNDGRRKCDVRLNRPSLGLHIPPLVWRVHHHYAPDSALLVLASQVYEVSDYIREFGEFQRLVQGNR